MENATSKPTSTGWVPRRTQSWMEKAAFQMRILFDIIGQTFRTLWAHKLRSFLTMFGIAWGVGSLLLLVGLGEGFRSGNQKQLNTMGENIVWVNGGWVVPAEGSHQGTRQYWVNYQDVEDIRKEATKVGWASPLISRENVKVQSQFQSAGGSVVGVEPVFSKIRWLPMGGGRWLNDADNAQRRRVAIVGWEMRKNLFPGRPALGENITLNGVRFTIVGYLESVGADENNATNQRLYIPYATMAELFPVNSNFMNNNAAQQAPHGVLTFINYKPIDRESHAEAVAQVKHIIARNHNFDGGVQDNFEIWDTAQNAESVGKIFTAMNMFLGSVGVVTLVLGAIGVINIMLVAVTERTKEIGLRKALGATNRNVMAQFFLEGAFLTLASGGLGIAAAAGFMRLLQFVPAPPGFDTPQIVPWSIAMAIGTLSFAGTVAGLYPARQAALLTPVEALRKE